MHTLQVMKRDRFTLILRFLHLNDSCLYKKKESLDTILSTNCDPLSALCLTTFRPITSLYRELSIDETMIGFMVEFTSSSTYPSNQPSGGMKAYVLADSHTG